MSEEQFNALKTDVHDIKEAVIGNEEYKRPGLIQRVQLIESWQTDVNLRVAKIIGAWIAVSAIIQIVVLYMEHNK
jgi:hypothetical protein